MLVDLAVMVVAAAAARVPVTAVRWMPAQQGKAVNTLTTSDKDYKSTVYSEQTLTRLQLGCVPCVSEQVTCWLQSQPLTPSASR